MKYKFLISKYQDTKALNITNDLNDFIFINITSYKKKRLAKKASRQPIKML
jgi:hypothetical protein